VSSQPLCVLDARFDRLFHHFHRFFHRIITTSRTHSAQAAAHIGRTPDRKEQQMKRITMISLVALGLIFLAGIVPGFRPPAEFRAAAQGAPDNGYNVFTVDVAADCRTFVEGSNRAEVSFGSGKIFPAGTLPSGQATNDPTQPVNGVAPIGDWTTRGQRAFPFPPEVTQSYSSTPAYFATQYYMLNDGRALTTECYASPSSGGACSVTGGIGGFRGAAGDQPFGTSLGTNATGCPNFRPVFNLKKDAPNYPGWPR
jgi:hypothetical protein